MNPRFFDLLITQTWQIAALAIVVAVIVRLVAKNRPHLAHAMWMLVLIKCVTPPLWGHSLGVFSQLQATFAHDDLAVSPVEPETNVSPAGAPVIELSTPSMELSAAEDRSLEFDEPEDSVFDSEAGSSFEVVAFDKNDAVESDETLSAIAAVGTASSKPAADDIDYRSVLIALFCTGAVITLLVMIFRCLRCLRLIHRYRTTEFDESLSFRIQQLSQQLRIRHAPQVIVSNVLFGPAVLGFLRHTIVLPRCLFEIMEGDSSRSFLPERTVFGRSFLPERTVFGRSFLPERISAEGEPAFQSTPEQCQTLPIEPTSSARVAAGREVLPGRQDLQKLLPGRQHLEFLDPILAHELIHIRRGDLRTGTLQAIVQSLWWFHPAVWFANRWLSREAERCCDEQVIAELGCTPGHYARSLLSVIESKHRLQPIPVFPGMRPVEITAQRMERIMSLKNGLKKRTPLWCWLMIAALAFVVLPGALAKPTPDENLPLAIAFDSDPIPRETVVSSSPQIEVSTETYQVGDLLERLAEEHGLSSGDTRKSLIGIVEKSIPPVIEMPQGFSEPPKVAASPSLLATPAPRQLSSISLDGDVLVVVQSDTGHAKLKEEIVRFRKFGFKRFQVTARFIMGTADEINTLMSSLKMDAPFSNIKKTPAVETKHKVAEGAKPEQPAVTTYRMGPIDIVSRDKVRAIEELARAKPDGLAVKCPQVEAFNGQTAMTHVGETKRYVVGFNGNDEPMINSIVEGPAFRVTPTFIHDGVVRLQCMSSLEGVGVAEIQPVSDSKREIESPQQVQVPATAPRRVQTTVELQHDQTLLLTGLKTTGDGQNQAVLVVLDAIPISLKPLTTNAPINESSEEAVNEKHEPVAAAKEPVAFAERLELCSYPVADLMVCQNPVVAAVGRDEDGDNHATPAVISAVALAVGPEKSSDPAAPKPISQPTGGNDIQTVVSAHVDFAPLTELIKATVQSETWDPRGKATMAIDRESLSLVIGQTDAAHDEIATLLSHLRDDQNANVRIQCRIVRLTNDSQITWLERQCSLHPLSPGSQWALLPQQRSEAFAQALSDQKPEVLFVPTVMTISGQMATIATGPSTAAETALSGIRLEITPHLLPESKVIRLQHSFSIGAFDDAMPEPIESLVGSGQTLLLFVNAPAENYKATAEQSHYLLMLTPEHVRLKEEEEKVVSP